MNIYQFKTDTDIAQPPANNIAVGGGIGGQTVVYFRMDMQGGLTGVLYYPQVEVKPIGAAFECVGGSPTPCTVTSGFFSEGSGVMFNGTTVQGWVSVGGVDGAFYHWQARVRNSSGTSGWISFGGNLDPGDTDIYIDNTPPAISPGTDGTCATAAINITDLSAIIKWNTNDIASGAQNPPGAGSYATAQVQYIKTSQFIDWGSTPGILSLSNPRENSPHQVNLARLSPSSGYTYKMLSRDAVDNETASSNCTFITTTTRPIKTIELFIGQEEDTYKNIPGGKSKKYFTITLPESPGTDISAKSAFIEIAGVSSSAGSQTVNAGLLRGDQTLGSGPAGENFLLDSSGTTTPFTILFDALNPPGIGQESMANITTGATPYDYTLFLTGDGTTDIWLFSAKLIITYSYVL